MKNTTRKFLIILITFFIITNISICSRAENEISQNDANTQEYDENDFTLDEELIDEEDQYLYDENQNSDLADYTYQKNFFSFGSSNVTVNEDVYGDVFIFTSGTATIDAFIAGNVFIFASDIEISESAQITTSLFACSNHLSILGGIDGNVYSFCQDFNLAETSYIDSDLFLNSQNIVIDGAIYRDANISGGSITLSENASIQGDFNYSSDQEINLPEGVVYGSVNYRNVNYTPNTTHTNQINQWIYHTFSYIVIAVIVFAIAKWIQLKFINLYPDFVKNLPKYLLYGILGLMVIPILGMIFLILGVTIPLSFVLFAIYFMLMLLASFIIIISIANLCSDKLSEKLTINDNLRTILCIIIIAILYKLLQLIPVFGSLLTFAVVITGFGLFLKSMFPTKQ